MPEERERKRRGRERNRGRKKDKKSKRAAKSGNVLKKSTQHHKKMTKREWKNGVLLPHPERPNE